MPDDLFGTVKQNVDRFRGRAVPRKKIGSSPRPRVGRVPEGPREMPSDEAIVRIRRQWEGNYLAWAFQELKRWKGRLPPDEYARQYARLRAQRAIYVEQK